MFPPKINSRVGEINSRVGEIYKLLCFEFHTMKICSIKIKFFIYNKKKGWCSATLPPFGGNTDICIYYIYNIYVYTKGKFQTKQYISV